MHENCKIKSKQIHHPICDVKKNIEENAAHWKIIISERWNKSTFKGLQYANKLLFFPNLGAFIHDCSNSPSVWDWAVEETQGQVSKCLLMLVTCKTFQ